MNFRRRRLALAAPFVLLLALLTGCNAGLSRPQGWAEPVVDGDTTYVFTGKNELSRIDIAEGRATVRWQFPNDDLADQKDIDLQSVYGKPVLHDGILYFGSYGGEMFAVSAKDGSLEWRSDKVQDAPKIDGSIVGGPTAAGDLLIFGTTESRLFAVTRADGRTAPGWPADGVEFEDGIWAAPAVNADTVFLATMDGTVHAVSLQDPTQERWQKPFKADGAAASLSLLDSGHLFLASLGQQAFILDPATGQALAGPVTATDWIWNDPAFKDGVVYFGDFSGKVFAVDITSGAVKWTYAAGRKLKSGPAIVNNVLVVADREPVVHLLDPANGALLNRVPLTNGGTVRADVATQGEVALIVTVKGNLFRADPKALTVVELPLVGVGQ